MLSSDDAQHKRRSWMENKEKEKDEIESEKYGGVKMVKKIDLVDRIWMNSIKYWCLTYNSYFMD